MKLTSMNNTDPQFFEKWDRNDLNYEAARLNRLLKDIQITLNRAQEEMDDICTICGANPITALCNNAGCDK